MSNDGKHVRTWQEIAAEASREKRPQQAPRARNRTGTRAGCARSKTDAATAYDQATAERIVVRD